MKHLRFLVVAAMAAIGMSAMAQVTYGYDYEYKPTKAAVYGSDNDAFGLFYAQYNAASQHMTITGHDSDNESLNGITLGYSYFIPLGDMPLFVSPGAAVQYFFKSKNGIKTNMISLKVPVNLMYSLQVSDAFRIEPYAGIYGRINIWGQMKDDDGDSVNIFDDSDMGDAAAKRFQLGWNAGVNFRITEAFTIGAGYFMDILKLQSYSSGKHDVKTNLQGFDITLGINF